jgi:AraC-like DNA-binding protein
LRDAASSIGYDYAYISKLFKRKVGISFRQYVNNLRIIESKPLLTAGDKSIGEIAELCGFSSLRAFDREFLNQVGVTPSKYQKQT